MTIVINGLVLPIAGGADAPHIGYKTIVNAGNITATSEDLPDFGIVNIANTATYLKWKATSVVTDQGIVISTTPGTTIDYFAIAGHNLGSNGARLTLQRSVGSPGYEDISVPITLSDDTVFINEFDSVAATGTGVSFRLLIEQSGSPVPTDPPEIGILYVGEITKLPRKKYAGYEPPTLNRTTRVSTGFSEDGQFLGRVKRNQKLENEFTIDVIDPDFYRSVLDPFAIAAEEIPFFWAWRPATFPDEVALMWLMEDVGVTNTGLPNHVQFTLNMQGIR